MTPLKLLPAQIFTPSPNVVWRWAEQNQKIFLLNLKSGKLYQMTGTFTKVFSRFDGWTSANAIVAADLKLSRFSQKSLQQHLQKMLQLDIIQETKNLSEKK